MKRISPSELLEKKAKRAHRRERGRESDSELIRMERES